MSDEARHPIVDEEVTLLAQVLQRLDEVPMLVPPSEREVVEELLRLRDEMQSAKEEDKGAIMQQYDQSFALLQQLRDARERPQVDPDSPYFAHLAIEAEDTTRHLYLGKATRIDHGLRIIDWRNAPISRIFYSYQEGEEFEEIFGGRPMEGTIAARRNVRITQRTLERIDCPDGVFVKTPEGWTARGQERPRLAGGQGTALAQVHAADGTSQRRLGTDGRGRAQRADKHLPDIAGLIDPDQFDLITRPNSGFVVIRGTAGSGKTTVALHRIAYLAYDDPSIDSPRTLFLAFSKALRDYVSRVLPALGVGRVQPRTFPEWAAEQRRKHFGKLPRKLRDDTPEVVLRLKTHPATMVALERQIEHVDGPATMEQAIDDWASVLVQEDVIGPVLKDFAPGAFSEAELRKAVEYCRDRQEELDAWLEGDRDEEVTVAMDAEDDALLLRAWQLRVGPLRHRGQSPLTYRHIAIDEVQDFSPVEVRVLLGCLDKNKSITLAGDTQQHVMANAGFTNWTQFFGWLGVEGAAVETLRVAYRSSEPIVTFAMAVLGELAEDDTAPLTVRGGPPVEVFPFTDMGAAVAFLADALKALTRDEPLANVAIVAPNGAVADIYYDGLRKSEVPRLRRVYNEDFSFSPGVEVVELRQVKGLEFDYVIVAEASAASYPDTPSMRRLLHVASTRAIHQLWLTCTGTLSPIVREALEADAAAQHH